MARQGALGRGFGVAGRRRGAVLAVALSWLAIGAGCDHAEVSAPAGEADPPTSRAVPVAASALDGAGDDTAPKASPTPEPAPDVKPPDRDAPPSPSDAGTCPDAVVDELGLLVSPERVEAGQPVRIVAATLTREDPLALRLEDGDGEPVEAELVHASGVPAATIARLTAPAAGRLTVVVGRDGEGLGCRTITVHRASSHGRSVRGALDDGVWPVTRAWDAAEEALYGAWVRALFHAPPGEELAWSALHEVTTDAERNLLHDHLGWGEDSMPMKGGLHLKPDCADTPYFLRAYFAWKRGLPFGYRLCSRGGGGQAPSCGQARGVLGKPDVAPDKRLPGELGVVQRFFRRTLSWGVHTGNGRTALDDQGTDFYPLVLERRSLRPGTIYADPYGHIFVLAELVPPEDGRPGILYAIDGQPDGSITRKRFWEGNFLWNPDPALGGSGFKGFRPHRVDVVDGRRRLVTATDAELRTMPGYRDVGPEQAKLDAPHFYDHMDGLITPGVRDPFLAQEEAIRALYESAKVRVTSVDNGQAHHASSSREVSMPAGFQIFETTGAWENFSTPARDLRLLIAIDVATGFDAKVARNPTAWGVEAAGGLEAVRQRLAAERERLLSDPALSFSYTRTDGSTWTLTLADLVARTKALEVAYNPNDCPEVRWGAPERSEERSTCRRRAPDDQRRTMEAYRAWFRERRRPPRGDPGPPVE